MPIYEYHCSRCDTVHDRLRKIDDRNDPVLCECGESCPLIISLPHAERWSDNWKFANLSRDDPSDPYGYAKFDSKEAYEQRLKDLNAVELAGPGNPGRPIGRFRKVYGQKAQQPTRTTSSW
jgi:putative FmdB family regulatory protein